MRIGILAASSLCLAACATGGPTTPAAPGRAEPQAAAESPLPAVADTTGGVVALVGEQPISRAAFVAEMERRGGRIPGRFATPEDRRALLEEMIRHRAVIAASRAAGFDRDPEFVALVERQLASRYLDAHLDEKLERIEIADSELEAFYREHAEEFRIPARMRGAWLFVAVPSKATPEKVEEARARAEEMRSRALALPAETKNFGSVALESSDDPGTRYIGGELGWVTELDAEGYRYGPEVVEALLALSTPGEVGPVVRTEKGFAVVKLVDREEAAPAPLEKLAPGIRNRLIKERREAMRDAFYAGLLEGLAVVVDDEALAAIEPLAPAAPREPAAPPPLPGGD